MLTVKIDFEDPEFPAKIKAAVDASIMEAFRVNNEKWDRALTDLLWNGTEGASDETLKLLQVRRVGLPPYLKRAK